MDLDRVDPPLSDEGVVPIVLRRVAPVRPRPVAARRAARRHDVRRSDLQHAFLTAAPLALVDLFSVFVSLALATLLLRWWQVDTLGSIVSQFVPIAITCWVGFVVCGLYPGTGLHPIHEVRLSTSAVTLVVLTAFFLGSPRPLAWSGGLLAFWGACVVLAPWFRRLTRRCVARCPWWGEPAIVVGRPAEAAVIFRHLSAEPAHGLKPIAIVANGPDESAELALDLPWCGSPHATALAEQRQVSWAILVGDLGGDPAGASSGVWPNGMEYLRHVRRVVVLHWMPGAPSLWNRSIDLAGLSGTQLREALSVPLSCFVKRSMDLVLSLLIGALALPLIAVIACLIKLSSPGPVFFCHQRIGRGGRVFNMWKFRSMVLDADATLDSYLDADPELRSEWERDHKLRLDPRMTAVGRWLRRTSLDELPQLWNVIRGEMSLVGPRPIVSSAEGSAYVERYPQSFEIYQRVRPGMTGLWQISGRNNTTYARRVQLDRYYVLNWSPWVDLFILCRTPRVVITGEGAC